MENGNQNGPSDGSAELIRVSDLFQKTWQLYKLGFKKFVGLELAALLGLLPLALIVGLYASASFFLKGSAAMAVIGVILGISGIVAVLFFIYILLASQAGAYLLLKDFSTDKKVFDLIKEARPYVAKYLITSFLTGLFVLLWTLLFIIPGIIFAVYYGFSLWAAMLEGKPALEAISRSKELVKGRWWAILGRFIVVGIAVYAISLIIAVPLASTKEGEPFYYIWSVVMNIFNLFVAPVTLIYASFLYKDLVRLKNGQVSPIVKS